MRIRTTLAVLGAAGVLTACGTADGTATQVPSEPPTSAASGGPPGAGLTRLVGLWGVQDAGEPADTVLRVSGDDLSLWRPCGVLSGGWRADPDGTFLADIVAAGTHGCASSGGPASQPVAVPWLSVARHVRPDRAGGWQLTDTRGTVVARLVPRVRPPTPRPDLAPELARPPVLDAATARLLTSPPTPAAGVQPAGESALAGRWVPDGRSPTGQPARPYLQLSAAGGWSSSDGCNGTTGRWTLTTTGRVLATSGGSTLIACANVNLAGWWTGAAFATVDDGALVLVDPQGRRLGRLVRAPLYRPMTDHPTPTR